MIRASAPAALRRRCATALVLAGVLLPAAAPAAAGAAPESDPAAWMFRPSEVVRIDLTLGPGAVDALAAEPGEYVPAGFELQGSDGRAFGPWSIELKLKGSASFRPLEGKAAFKLKFPSGSRPGGLKKLTLNNMVQDPSKVREAVAYELFRAMDVAAPRTGYAQVRVNGADLGLYLNLETLDEVALRRWFPTTGHLYESVMTDDWRALSTLEPGGEAFFEVDEGDEEDRADLQALIAALHGGGAGELATVLGEHADLGQMARMLATEAVTGHWDGYGWNVNNFYLHADAAGRFSLLPWGADQVMQSWFPLGGGPWEPRGVLLRRCLADPACEAARRAAAGRARELIAELGLRERAAALHAHLRPLIEADPRREHSLEASDAAAAEVQAFLAAREGPEPGTGPPAPAPAEGAPAAVDAPPARGAVAPVAAASPPVARLGAARARAAARRALLLRFGRRFRDGGGRRLVCVRLAPAAHRCRARWTSRGRRHERRVVVRLDAAGRLTSRIARPVRHP